MKVHFYGSVEFLIEVLLVCLFYFVLWSLRLEVIRKGRMTSHQHKVLLDDRNPGQRGVPVPVNTVDRCVGVTGGNFVNKVRVPSCDPCVLRL